MSVQVSSLPGSNPCCAPLPISLGGTGLERRRRRTRGRRRKEEEEEEEEEEEKEEEGEEEEEKSSSVCDSFWLFPSSDITFNNMSIYLDVNL